MFRFPQFILGQRCKGKLFCPSYLHGCVRVPEFTNIGKLCRSLYLWTNLQQEPELALKDIKKTFTRPWIIFHNLGSLNSNTNRKDRGMLKKIKSYSVCIKYTVVKKYIYFQKQYLGVS